MDHPVFNCQLWLYVAFYDLLWSFMVSHGL